MLPRQGHGGVDFNSHTNYKNCSKKQYEIYVCMPPKGTIVLNKLEQYKIIQQLGNRSWFTTETIAKLQQEKNPLYQVLSNLVSQNMVYVVNDSTPFVLAGTCGEMWLISPDKLQKTYNFLSGGQPIQINQNH